MTTISLWSSGSSVTRCWGCDGCGCGCAAGGGALVRLVEVGRLSERDLGGDGAGGGGDTDCAGTESVGSGSGSDRGRDSANIDERGGESCRAATDAVSTADACEETEACGGGGELARVTGAATGS